MIRISITAAAYEAIAASMPLGSVGVDPEPGAEGERHIWLEPRVVDRLRAMRGPGESYSDDLEGRQRASVGKGCGQDAWAAAILTARHAPSKSG